MTNDHAKNLGLPRTASLFPTLYQLDERNVVLLIELLRYLKKDAEWLNNFFPKIQDDIVILP